jgi:uncharacterized repeat protein (TIGR03843 family)
MLKELDRQTILQALQTGNIKLQGQFINSSNYTFFGNLEYQSQIVPVVYKPIRGERPLWDFPSGTLAKREVAAYIVSEALRWNLVPPTVFRSLGGLGEGSVQQFIDHNPEDHYFNFPEEERQRLRKVVLFDALINNADRKASHIFHGEDNHIWLIDHGLCFHCEYKLRTVIWDFIGQSVPQEDLTALQRLLEGKKLQPTINEKLRAYLSPGEIKAFTTRAIYLLRTGCFPIPSEEYRPYPWPPV